MTTRGAVTLDTLADYVENHVATQAQVEGIKTELEQDIESPRDEMNDRFRDIESGLNG